MYFPFAGGSEIDICLKKKPENGTKERRDSARGREIEEEEEKNGRGRRLHTKSATMREDIFMS
jgi:hypothetical protein